MNDKWENIWLKAVGGWMIVTMVLFTAIYVYGIGAIVSMFWLFFGG